MQGTVGASGDLAPLSHLALGMMGEGEMWDPRTGECVFRGRPRPAHAAHGAASGRFCARLAPAGDVLAAHGLKPVHLSVRPACQPLGNGAAFTFPLGPRRQRRAWL